MDNIPYGFDCYAFMQNELKYFDSNILSFKSLGVIPYSLQMNALDAQQSYKHNATNITYPGYIRFTRKNEDYSPEQIVALTKAGRLNLNNEIGRQVFCGIKIQLGIGVVTNFLKKGLLYRSPNKGRAELINGTWTGIVSGLTLDRDAANSYDIAFGNFLAWDQEYPHMKFGPFFAVESKLVLLTGSSRRVETSSFGTNIGLQVWITIFSLMVVLSILASIWINWQREKMRYQQFSERASRYISNQDEHAKGRLRWFAARVVEFFFIYFTMLLNKPSMEFDDKIWPTSKKEDTLDSSDSRHKRQLPSPIRILSYLWSAACFVMASIYSGELLAVILLHTDQNIDTISELINSKPQIEPVIRQDDFTYNLMLKSLDQNMLILHNKTRLIPRSEVYTSHFIEQVSERKVALLGDDELIETIYDIYHKRYPLYRSKITYLQYPISVMYRKDFNLTLEHKLRRGIVQALECGLIQRWYQAQKDTYIQFYQRKKSDPETGGEDIGARISSSPYHNYKPLSRAHFSSFFRLMAICIAFAHVVLLVEILHAHLNRADQ